MPAILFPGGMKNKKIKEESIFMFYDPQTTDGKPNTLTTSEIREFLTGNVSPGNKNFITGDTAATLFGENAIHPREELNGHIAQFNETGQLSSAGTYLQFENNFLLNTSSSFK